MSQLRWARTGDVLGHEVLRLVVGKDEEGNVVRALQTSAEPNADAKDRSGKLDHYEQPDLGAVYAKIMEV